MTAKNPSPGLPVRVEVENEWVWCGEHRLKLTPKTFAVLRYLIEHAGKLVTKDQLLQAVWPDTVVSEWALTSCLREIRKALGDTPQAPQYIETVHRRGIRFIGEVQSPRSKVQGPKTDPAPNTQHLAPTLVGRDAELAQLHSWLGKALNGERQIVFVTGEPGIGKTTLIEAFLFGVRSREQFGVHNSEPRTLNPELPSTPRPWIGRGQCIEHFGAGEAYLPVLEALGRLCREPGHERLIDVLHQYAPTWLVQMPALLSAADLEALQRKVQGATRERMLREMAEALEVLTAERGLVLWLEDLHWSDYSTLDLISFLARRLEKARLLVLGTYRPIDVIVREHPLKTVKQELELHGHCRELSLELLPEQAVREYLTVRFPREVGARHALPLQRLVQLVHQRTEGNPLFMVTVTDAVVAQGVLVEREGRWELRAEIEEVERRIPPSLHHFIEQQLERVSPEEQQVLEAASVAGMDFSAAAVAAGIEESVETVEKHCEGLARRKQFLQVRGTEEWPDGTMAARYGFLHALYQEVMYERVAAGQRSRLHRRIGEREERAYGKRAREIAAELAVHFERGRDYRKALQYLQQAGENATQRSAYQEATSHFTKGLEVLKTLPDTPDHVQQELTLQLALSDALLPVKGYTAPEVEKAGTRARELCQQLGETPQLFPVLGRLAVFYIMRGDLRTARELVEQQMRLAQSLQDRYLLSLAHGALGGTLFFLGELTSARTHLAQAITLYNPQQHRRSTFNTVDPRVDWLSSASWTLSLLGYPEQALKRSQEAVALAERLSHSFSLTFALDCVAWFHLLRREGPLAQARAEAMMALSREQGFPHFVAEGIFLRGWALVEQGQEEEGVVQIRQGLAAVRAMGSEVTRQHWLALLAEACGKVGRTEEGLTLLAEALDTGHKSGQSMWEAELYRLKGTLTLQHANQKAKVKRQKSKVETSPEHLTPSTRVEAEACFQKAIEIARRQQAKSLELRATISLARLWQQQGKRHEAHSLLSEVYNWFTEGFETKDLQEAQALLEELSY